MPTVTTDTTTETSNTNPHIREKNSPLESLIFQALRRYGDFSPGTLDGDVGLMFLEFANMVIDDIRMHPYAPSTTTTTTSGDTTTTTTTVNGIDYYESLQDVREIDDIIIVQGLLYHYALQQGSEKVSVYLPTYNTTLNRQLWRQKNGNTKIRMTVVDDGTNKGNINKGKTDTVNGTVSY